MTDSEFEPTDDYKRRLQRLREAIAEGEEGEAVPWTPELMEQILRNADERQRRGEMPNLDVCPQISEPPGGLPAARTARGVG